jgi:hypothetical protein
MKRFYYDIHVNYGHGGYSICVSAQKELTDDEIINLIPKNKFEETEDRELIDSIDEITKKQAFDWYSESRIIKLD